MSTFNAPPSNSWYLSPNCSLRNKQPEGGGPCRSAGGALLLWDTDLLDNFTAVSAVMGRDKWVTWEEQDWLVPCTCECVCVCVDCVCACVDCVRHVTMLQFCVFVLFISSVCLALSVGSLCVFFPSLPVCYFFTNSFLLPTHTNAHQVQSPPRYDIYILYIS